MIWYTLVLPYSAGLVLFWSYYHRLNNPGPFDLLGLAAIASGTSLLFVAPIGFLVGGMVLPIIVLAPRSIGTAIHLCSIPPMALIASGHLDVKMFPVLEHRVGIVVVGIIVSMAYYHALLSRTGGGRRAEDGT